MRAVAGADFIVANDLEKTAVKNLVVIPSESLALSIVEWVEESPDVVFANCYGIPRLRSGSLGMTGTTL
jgi:hypothetical protein